MSHDTKPAPFNTGDHVRYIASEKLVVPSGPLKEMNQVLVPGMAGVIILSTGALSAEGEAAPNPWHCQVQFQNGFQFDITPENRADFEMAHGSGPPVA